MVATAILFRTGQYGSAVETWVTTGPVVERCAATARPIDELVCDHKISHLYFGLQGADGGRGDDVPYTKRLESPDVGTVVDHVRWKLMMLAVTGKKRDLAAGDLAQRNEVRWGSVRCFDLDVLRVLEKRIEPGTTDDPDLSTLSHVFLLCDTQPGCA